MRHARYTDVCSGTEGCRSLDRPPTLDGAGGLRIHPIARRSMVGPRRFCHKGHEKEAKDAAFRGRRLLDFRAAALRCSRIPADGNSLRECTSPDPRTTTSRPCESYRRCLRSDFRRSRWGRENRGENSVCGILSAPTRPPVTREEATLRPSCLSCPLRQNLRARAFYDAM